MSGAPSLTPMLRQFRSLKQQHPDSILLFRMGDFYEMFHEDAAHASRLLDLTLTARGKGTDHVVPMCGFPHHQLDPYVARLVNRGEKVAICEQVEDPRLAKGLVKREVVRVVTPGTFNDPTQLDARANVWLAAVAAAEGRIGAALLDASTGEFLCWEPQPEERDGNTALVELLRGFRPVELVHPEGLDLVELLRAQLPGPVAASAREPYAFALASARERIERELCVMTLDGFGLRDRPAAVSAAGGLLAYVQETQKCGLEHLDRIRFHEPSCFLRLDPATCRNLELERNLRDGGREGSLLGSIDETVTAGGGRLLRRFLLAPLLDVDGIRARQDAVEELLAAGLLRDSVRAQLRQVQDLERLLARAVAGTANARDLQALGRSLERTPDLLLELAEVASPLLRRELDGLDPCADVAARLDRALVDPPPATLREGGILRDGFHAELDELRLVRRDGRTYIAELEARERAATGIPSLKVRFNRVFGYFIEVTRTNLHLVPGHYQRKQTIANGERYVTPDLKEHEVKVLHAQDRIEALELELFQVLRTEVASHASRIKAVAQATAHLDVVAALAQLAAERGYCRPVLSDAAVLHVRAGRHPVIEHMPSTRHFVPNDTELVAGSRAIAVLTGPNMGGKSTYLRQVALIVILAQAGSFVPAEAVELGVVDRIFCRVGASDSLAEGHSTFMVEMSETANILHHATSRSLLLLDEIGRGTSTFDGLSLAWAVVEHLVAVAGGAPRTLFATHYHELTELAVELPTVFNMRMAVRESAGQVSFLHRVEVGASDRSYGIHVARLAGVPAPVVQRAAEILANLERDEYGRDGLPRRARRRAGRGAAQPSLFDGSARGPEAHSAGVTEILAALRQQDPERLTPLEALQLLSTWRRRLAEDESDPS